MLKSCLDPSQGLLGIWEAARSFLNSAFISAFLSALAGALFGVWGAQRVAERSARRNELRDSLRQTNALIVLATTICNQALGLKKQHIADLTKTYFDNRVGADEMNETLRGGGVPKVPMKFQADLVHITPLTVPIEAMKSLAYSAQLLPGRALALVAMVDLSLVEQAHAVALRAEQILLFKRQDLPVEIFVQTYFGLRRVDGSVDAMYHDSMVALSQYTDDVAFFASELAEELEAHALRVRERLLSLTKDAGKASSVDFSEARASGLLPPRANYESWLSGFKST
jgi:hypothetical protein